jgi:nicotinamide-nucleotide amidase
MSSPPLTAEIIAIGTELTSGAKLDTNSQWLSLALADLGISVLFHTTIADDLPANISAIRAATERVGLVIITGGLGPTLDDLTRDVLAQVAGVPLELDPTSLDLIETYFRNRGRPMPERNRVQAMFPAGAVSLPNPVGTAPGIWMMVPVPGKAPCLVAALPGVPSEMHRMFADQVRPRLPGSGLVMKRVRIHSFGLGEAQVDEMLVDVTARGRDPEVGITAHQATITLRINAQGVTEAECDEKIAATREIIEQRLGQIVFGTEDDELEDAVVRLLNQRRQTVATIECGTGGALAAALADSDHDGAFLQGSIVPAARWADPSSTDSRLLPCATEEAALRVQAATGSDYALAVSPYRTPQTMDARPEVAYIALEGPGTTITERVLISGNPSIQQARVVKTALDLLRRHLLETPTPTK